jgi:hypothetical protein
LSDRLKGGIADQKRYPAAVDPAGRPAAEDTVAQGQLDDRGTAKSLLFGRHPHETETDLAGTPLNRPPFLT